MLISLIKPLVTDSSHQQQLPKGSSTITGLQLQSVPLHLSHLWCPMSDTWLLPPPCTSFLKHTLKKQKGRFFLIHSHFYSVIDHEKVKIISAL